MRTMLAVLVACCCSLAALAQCHFVAKPVAMTGWYRSEGWALPGIADGKIVGPASARINDKPPAWPEGITISVIEHDPGYRVSFPEAVFQENGVQMKMEARSIPLNGLYRWEIFGKPYAYSYDLWPDDVGCAFSADFMDDKGDGVFRVMASPGHLGRREFTKDGGYREPQPPPLPEWASKPKA